MAGLGCLGMDEVACLGMLVRLGMDEEVLLGMLRLGMLRLGIRDLRGARRLTGARHQPGHVGGLDVPERILTAARVGPRNGDARPELNG